MGRPNVVTAIKLLTKAQSTTSEPEAIALVERSYGLLAQIINVYDAEHAGDGPRRRERRRLLERRRRGRADGASVKGQTPAAVRAADSVARYGGLTGDADTGRSGVDVSL
jgi:hypothetical protein